MEAARKNSPRLIVPDLARGLALLGIAVANASQAWIINDYSMDSTPGSTLGGVRPDSALDQVLAVLSAMFVHVRGLPMFSTLLGFGIGLIAASLYRKNYPAKAARSVLLRRYLWLAAFGVIHLVALFYGDIMTTYGIAGAIVALMLTLSTNALRIIAYALIALSVVMFTASAGLLAVMDLGIVLDEIIMPTTEIDSLPEYLQENAAFSLLVLTSQPVSAFMLGGLVLIGFIWAREGYLVDVDKHRRVLVNWVIVAAAVVILVGLPLGLSAIGVIDPGYELAFSTLNYGWGLLTGPGILAALALVVNPVQKEMHRRYAESGDASAPAWAYPFVALGKRSMSGYLAQSFLFIGLTMPFALGWGAESSIAGKTAVGALIWLITLLLACALEAAGWQGPFEKVHRRLAYGRAERIEPYSAENSAEQNSAAQNDPKQLP
ncbi:DUF418 domain-containing protein [Corynebacterium auris]|uniref:DUF418 domain-containing protein n=1 Tax=Corynebacterium auris TaxID=44750 RepID=UPI0025B39106|nr:DUF418 domain-containing protein [Corynebacterium auris]WJY67540.1 hypothetical protein CAURIS_03085 [Corynebacterium auris]